MPDIYVVLVGGDRVRPTATVTATIFSALNPIARSAGHPLQVLLGPPPASVPSSNVFTLNFTLTSSVPARQALGYTPQGGRSICMRGLTRPVAMGLEDGGTIIVEAFLDYRVGGGPQMTGRILNNPTVNYAAQAGLVFQNNEPELARAVGNTCVHELGHAIARLGDTTDVLNFMGPATEGSAAGNRDLLRLQMSCQKSFNAQQVTALQAAFRALP